MMRNKFDEQLEILNNELIEMGAMVESAIANATNAIVKQDKNLADKAIQFERDIDQKEKDIESLCLKLLLQQQPVARDLRMISSALKMITDMERIGDQAQDISEIAIFLADKPYLQIDHLHEMATATIAMVNNSIDAYVKKDVDLACEVIKSDDVVDDLFIKTKKDLIEIIRESAALGEQAMDLLMVSKYFERIGDHATNIAEWVVFSITGEHQAE